MLSKGLCAKKNSTFTAATALQAGSALSPRRDITFAHARKNSTYHTQDSDENTRCYIPSPVHVSPCTPRSKEKLRQMGSTGGSSASRSKSSKVLETLDTTEPISTRCLMDRILAMPDLAGISWSTKHSKDQLIQNHSTTLGSEKRGIKRKRKPTPEASDDENSVASENDFESYEGQSSVFRYNSAHTPPNPHPYITAEDLPSPSLRLHQYTDGHLESVPMVMDDSNVYRNSADEYCDFGALADVSSPTTFCRSSEEHYAALRKPEKTAWSPKVPSILMETNTYSASNSFLSPPKTPLPKVIAEHCPIYSDGPVFGDIFETGDPWEAIGVILGFPSKSQQNEPKDAQEVTREPLSMLAKVHGASSDHTDDWSILDNLKDDGLEGVDLESPNPLHEDFIQHPSRYQHEATLGQNDDFNDPYSLARVRIDITPIYSGKYTSNVKSSALKRQEKASSSPIPKEIRAYVHPILQEQPHVTLNNRLECTKPYSPFPPLSSCRQKSPPRLSIAYSSSPFGVTRSSHWTTSPGSATIDEQHNEVDDNRVSQQFISSHLEGDRDMMYHSRYSDDRKQIFGDILHDRIGSSVGQTSHPLAQATSPSHLITSKVVQDHEIEEASARYTPQSPPDKLARSHANADESYPYIPTALVDPLRHSPVSTSVLGFNSMEELNPTPSRSPALLPARAAVDASSLTADGAQTMLATRELKEVAGIFHGPCLFSDDDDDE
ncbi:hypothetical protein BDQ12DRAFT_737466 [Crucibulum laeve]|uniref:Uncharacterized protein n=1 Tax=Crucibulum laeve TaxID=68775 RepID=A0A5C3LR48_9AGAR|nr:hypothetical protein BDQ12DRAFT_737466 [Crucibulum laeve]